MRNWLKEIRTEKGMIQREVAEPCKITTEFYCMIENGERRPSPEVAQKIAKVLGFDWTNFFRSEEAV